MATKDALSLHNKGGIDILDYVGAPAFGLSAVVLTGIGTFSMFGISLSETLLSGTGITVSIAFVIAFLLMGAAWFTNRAGDSWDDLDDVESYTVAGGMLFLLGVAFVPAISEAVASSNVMGVVAFMALSGAYTVLAWY